MSDFLGGLLAGIGLGLGLSMWTVWTILKDDDE